MSALLIGLAGTTNARAEETVPSVAVKTAALLQAEFAFDPPPSPEATVGPDDQVVALPTLTVSASIQNRQLELAVAEQKRRFEAKQFSPVRGGTLIEKEFGRTKVELGGWSQGPRWGFLKVSW